MELVNVLHMKGGLGEMSYANNSLVQRKVITMTKPIREEAISQLYTAMFPKIMSIADLACSSGPNAFLVSAELIKIVDKLRRKLGHDRSPEFEINLNDLPSNDFNLLFQSLLSRFQHEMGSEFGPFFVHGIPGTFYGRLFASQSLHFVHSSYGLHWLSKVPEGLEMNKENICITSTSPQEEEGSFTINRLESSEVSWSASSPEDSDVEQDGYYMAKCVRAAVEPLLLQHFGELIDPLFEKYAEILGARMSKEEAKCVNVTISVTKLG